MSLASGVLTELGGATSHAAVVTRELGVPCVVGCGPGSLMGLDGRTVTIDGTAGEVLDGGSGLTAAPALELEADLEQLATWAAQRGDLGRVRGPSPSR
jgi:pyruvate,orthophosphate dikinase